MITELGAARSLRGPWRSLSSPSTCVLASQHSSASRVISFGFIYPAKARSSLTLSARCVADRTQFSRDFRFAMADSPADIERALDVLRETMRPEKLFTELCVPLIFHPPIYSAYPHLHEAVWSFFVITRCYIVRALSRSRAEPTTCARCLSPKAICTRRIH